MTRLEQEKNTVELMIRLYCNKKHGTRRNSLCPDCLALRDYAWGQVDNCRFGQNKPHCDRCAVHCYELSMREKIRQVMRYSGPRMLLYHPVIAIKHLL